MDVFQAPVGCLVQPNVRCLVGLHGIQKDDVLDQAFSAALDVEPEEDPELLRHALDVEDTDQIQFLVGSQSLNYNENQVTLITLLEGDDENPLAHLVKQSFGHPDGEVVGLTALAAQPSWFVSIYSTYSSESADFRSGARVWRLPDSSFTTVNNRSSMEPKVTDPELEYVTSLPLGNYSTIKKIASHPSPNCADLACLVSHPVNTSGSAPHFSTSTTHLVILQAPDGSNGDYRELASAPLSWPSPSHIFTSHLKAAPNQLLKSASSTSQVPITSKSHAIRWSPFQQAGHLAVAFESGVLGWDIRSMTPSFWLEAAHWPCVRDLDFNPHRPSILATGGDDGHIRLWDLRYLKPKTNLQSPKPTTDFLGTPEQCTEPLHSVAAHSHWVWSVRYHPTRDQLLLSAGSDSRVCLHNLSSFSSDALDVTVDEDNEDEDCRSSSTSLLEQKTLGSQRLKDGVIARMEVHEESIYAADWSPVDPWYFASVSYDGNLLVNQVPEALKFKILLDEAEE